MKQQISPVTAIGAIVGVLVLVVIAVLAIQARGKTLENATSKDQFKPVSAQDEMRVPRNPMQGKQMGKGPG